ncbi:MAG: hypothetical protein U0746_17740 [Gemmataceae bacterium]
MADANLKNWLVAERSGEFKVYSHLEWKELGEGDGWAIVTDDLTETQATEELIRRAPPEKRA